MADEPHNDPLTKLPLMAFSIYSAGQAQTLERIGNQLLSISKDWKTGEVVFNFTGYCDLFWLWVLGAYEVLRTLDEKPEMFAIDVSSKTHLLKQEVSKLRMPFAKQQLRNRGGPIYAENSAVDIGNGIVFQIGHEHIHSDELIEQVLGHLGSIKISDIKGELPIRRDEPSCEG